jgi:hypothetical protein
MKSNNGRGAVGERNLGFGCRTDRPLLGRAKIGSHVAPVVFGRQTQYFGRLLWCSARKINSVAAQIVPGGKRPIISKVLRV